MTKSPEGGATICRRALCRGHRIAKRGFVAVKKSAEGGAVTICRRKIHHHPRPIGRGEIYRESRTLSIWQIVAGKFRPKKKRRGQETIILLVVIRLYRGQEIFYIWWRW